MLQNWLASSISVVLSSVLLCLAVVEMDSSKILRDTEECSSSESGWTMYIDSPDKEYSPADDEDVEGGSIGQQGYKKDADEADSDDSMASDASSGPSDPGNLCGHLGRYRDFGHAWDRNERKYVAQKHDQQEEKSKHQNQTKGEKDKSGKRANGAGRFKKI